jgi:hypothetical protein
VRADLLDERRDTTNELKNEIVDTKHDSQPFAPTNGVEPEDRRAED